MQKANKDGWIRHRGGKCPVENHVVVNVRTRDGLIGTGIAGNQDWRHIGLYKDVMAYRIHAPEQAEKSIEQRIIEAEQSALAAQANAEAKYFDGPLQWRDRILELDREQVTADFDHKDATDARDAEKAELVAKLKSEGLALISEPIKAEDSAQGVDMSDPRNWRVGDLLRKTKRDVLSSEGYIATITEIEEDRITSTDECGGDSWSSFEEVTDDHEWHSRP